MSKKVAAIILNALVAWGVAVRAVEHNVHVCPSKAVVGFSSNL